MVSITFDTHKFIQKLEAAGMPEKQAEAQADLMREVISDSLSNQMANKQDVSEIKSELKADILKLDMKIKLLQWMVGLVIVVEVMPLLKTLF